MDTFTLPPHSDELTMSKPMTELLLKHVERAKICLSASYIGDCMRHIHAIETLVVRTLADPQREQAMALEQAEDLEFA